MTTIQPFNRVCLHDVRIGEPDLQHQIELISNVNVEAFVIRIKIQYFGDALFRERIVRRRSTRPGAPPQRTREKISARRWWLSAGMRGEKNPMFARKSHSMLDLRSNYLIPFLIWSQLTGFSIPEKEKYCFYLIATSSCWR